ncbi:MAG TPA: PIG-L family deacetylase [Thermoanaerobaculia bacterium]|nr:PIG-L family deacetylase [Thermoanaerobaculia bacterium]
MALSSFSPARVLALAMFLLLAGCRAVPHPATGMPSRQFQLTDGDRVLVLVPHPDDEVLGAGGVLREAVSRGLPVRVVFLTHGDSNEWSFLAFRKRPVVMPRAVLAMGEIRQREALAAAEALGVPTADLTFLGYPDYGTLAIWRSHWGGQRPPDRGRLTRARAVPYPAAFRPGAPFKGEEILTDLEAILRDFRPTRIFVSHPADHHPDHAALYLFTRVALWDLQGETPEISATLHPFLVHYPRWPRVKGFRPGDEMSPPARLLAGFTWQTRELSKEEMAAKRQALTAHRTQYGYSASRLLPFVRANELYGDLAIPALASGAGAVRLLDEPALEDVAEPAPAGDDEEEPSEIVDLQDLSVRLVRDQVEIGMDLRRPLPEGSAVSLSAFGYRPGLSFAGMPKLELRIEPHAYTVRDQGRSLPRSTVGAAAKGRQLAARIPLSSLGNPQRLFLQVRTSTPRTPLGQTPWWIVELRGTPGVQRAAQEPTAAPVVEARADIAAPR